MISATGIERRPTSRAFVRAAQIFADGHLRAAGSAKDGGLIPLSGRPNFRRMAGQFVMAIPAGVVGPAASHLDGDDIQTAMVVRAARFSVERDAAYG